MVKEAKERGIPIRIGVNAGSLPPIPALKDGELPPSMVDRMVDAAMWEIRILEDMDYDNIKISMKAFDVPTMVEANRRLASDDPVPAAPRRHGGGPARAPAPCAAPSAWASCSRRASATRSASRWPPTRRKKMPVCYDILNTLGLRRHGATLVACPTCGRIEIELIPLAQKVEEYFDEARQADHGCGHGLRRQRPRRSARWPTSASPAARARGVIFRKGEIIRTVDEPEFLSALIEEGEPRDRRDGVGRGAGLPRRRRADTRLT